MNLTKIAERPSSRFSSSKFTTAFASCLVAVACGTSVPTQTDADGGSVTVDAGSSQCTVATNKTTVCSRLFAINAVDLCCGGSAISQAEFFAIGKVGSLSECEKNIGACTSADQDIIDAFSACVATAVGSCKADQKAYFASVQKCNDDHKVSSACRDVAK